jgi:hypothetical protein
MKCPKCGSEHIRKNGIKQGKQNHICAECGRQFINPSEQTKAFPETTKQTCLKMYLNGMGFRAIERVMGVHHTMVTELAEVQSLIGLDKKGRSYLIQSPQKMSPMLANWMNWKHLSAQKKQDMGVDSSRPLS